MAAIARSDCGLVDATRDAIDTYLAAMREDGWVMVRDAGTALPMLEGYHGKSWADGWNDCRAAMLKGTGDGQG